MHPYDKNNSEESLMRSILFLLILTLLVPVASLEAAAHGDVTPQAVDTTGLPPLGPDILSSNPYSGNARALEIGTSAFNQNCARCHGLEAISGGIAPDLRKLDMDCMSLVDVAKKQGCFDDHNQYFMASVLHGKVRNGNVYMPPFQGFFSQEAIWSIKTYLESRRVTE
jgi:cytochrome c-550 PedF